MSNAATAQILPSSLQGVPGLKMRSVNIALALATLALPVAVASSFGITTSVGLSNVLVAGSFAYLLPAAFAATLIVPAVDAARPWTRVVDIAAAALACGFLAFVAYAIISAIGQINDAQRAFGSMIGGYPRQSFASIFPGIGAIPIAILALMSSWKAWRGR
ncbi:hypothetical protein ACFZ8E_02545 [Methylobacterium sp. HMF5984]|uniref:hypothetical protein n=1 Tax=Methylobacterium sp. HMF5984 TaxID=3367370 RepID=UPI003854405C